MDKILEVLLLILLHLLAAVICGILLYFLPILGWLLVLLAIIFRGALKKNTKNKLNSEAIAVSAILIFFVTMFLMTPDGYPSAAQNAKIESYLDQMKTTFTVYYNINKDSYAGVDKNSEYLILQKKIEDVYGNRWTENYYSAQIKEKEYCVRAKLLSRDIYWCIDSRGYEGEVAKQYCTAEKPYCAE